MRAGAWVGLIALVAACGDGEPGAPADAARHDGSSPTDAAGGDASVDGAPLDAAPPACDDDPGLPEPPTCAQAIPWAAYIGDELLDGRDEVFALTMDGPPGDPLVASGDHRVFFTPVRHTWEFAPGGGAIAFLTADETDRWELYAVPLSGTGPGAVRPVSGPFVADGDVDWWAWSPDGRKLAYVADQDEWSIFDLWVLDLASDGPARRVNQPLQTGGVWVGNGDQMPFSWSPDSSMLAFRGSQGPAGTDHLYIADVSGPTPAPAVPLLLETDDLLARRWTWAPDSRSIAVFAVPSGSLQLARVACGAVTGGPHVVSAAPTLGEVFSAEGDLLFLAQIADGSAALFRADPAATPPVATQISEPAAVGFDAALAWSPTAPRVAFQAGRRLEVLDGTSGLRSVLNGPLVAGGSVRRFVWSPDGQSIAYTAFQLDVDQLELFHVDMSGAGPSRRRRVSLPVDHAIRIANMWWSPDSTHLAYVGTQDLATRVELYAGARSGGLISQPVKLNPDFEQDEASVIRARWSPAGDRLLYNATLTGAADFDAFAVSPAAPGDAAQISGGPDVLDVAWAPCPAP